MYVLGVTGNIGSGKSSVSKRFAEHGAMVSHSDDLAKYLLENDKALLGQLCKHFGDDILDGSGQLQRHILAERAFSSKEGQQYLNQLIHPKVWEATKKRIDVAREQGHVLFIVDAPLLYEAGVDSYTDSVLVVTANDLSRQSRIYERSRISTEDFTRRDKLQMSIEKKMQQADYVIYNDGSLEELFEKVDNLYRQIMR